MIAPTLSTTNASLQLCGRDGSATMLVTKRSGDVTPEVNIRERVTHTPPPSMNKAAHFGFETQRRHHQKSKTGASVAPQKSSCPPNFFLKRTIEVKPTDSPQ